MAPPSLPFTYRSISLLCYLLPLYTSPPSLDLLCVISFLNSLHTLFFPGYISSRGTSSPTLRLPVYISSRGTFSLILHLPFSDLQITPCLPSAPPLRLEEHASVSSPQQTFRGIIHRKSPRTPIDTHDSFLMHRILKQIIIVVRTNSCIKNKIFMLRQWV